MTFKFGKPSSGGSGFSKEAHEGHLLVFVEPEAEETTGAYGDSTAARCAFVVCLTCDTVAADVMLWGAALVPALTDGAEELVVGRLARGEAKGNRSAPWLLWNPSEADVAEAEEWFAKRATRYPGSGRISIELPKPERRKPEPVPGGDEPF